MLVKLIVVSYRIEEKVQVEHTLIDTLKKLGVTNAKSLTTLMDAVPLEVAEEAVKPKSNVQAAGAGYKEVWNVDNFAKSWARNGFYEAGGCLTWCHPFNNTTAFINSIPEEDYSWSEIVELESRFQPRHWNETSKEQELSIIFPLPLIGYATKDNVLPAGHYPKMILLHFGTALVYAWWTAMYKALRAGDNQIILMLWTAACSATIRLHKD